MPWHPIEQARRISADEILCVDTPQDRPWALIRKLNFNGEIWYRAVTPDADPAARTLIGYSQNLRALAFHAYQLYLTGYASNTGPINGWSESKQAG